MYKQYTAQRTTHKLMTQYELAAFLEIAPSSVSAYIRAGIFPRGERQIGLRYFFTEEQARQIKKLLYAK